MTESFDLVIITGMSGAGKTMAMQAFEDLGYFCVDNMPPALLPKFWELVKKSGKISKVALVVDLRSRAFYDQIIDMLANLDNNAYVHSQIYFWMLPTKNWYPVIKKPAVHIPGNGKPVDGWH